jgi:dephospho-CoA kinase
MITFVCGQLCSGKTLYSETLREIDKGVYIEVGNLVRRWKETQDRKELQDSKHLLNKIVNYIKSDAKAFSGQIVVSGVRQKEILEAFPEATLLWIECPTETRKKRYLDRQREGDTQTFEEAEQGDIDLGILEVKKYIFNKS